TVKTAGVSLQNGVLLIVGTEGDDQVSINQPGGSGTLKVRASFLEQTLTFNVADVSRIEVSLCGGNDHLVVSGNVLIPVLVDAGAGSNVLKAGGGPTVLLGGAGNDVLVGGSGRGLLIGGGGRD